MSTHSIHLQDKRKKISLNYPYIVFGGNPYGLKNVFDTSMVNEPSVFEQLKFYCISKRPSFATFYNEITVIQFWRFCFAREMFTCVQSLPLGYNVRYCVDW